MTAPHVRELTPDYLAQLRRESSREIRREYRRIPPPEFLSAELVRLDDEVKRLIIRHRTVFAEWTRLSGDDAVREAIDIDRDAAVAALRAGKPANSAGGKAEAARRQKLTDLDAEFAATPALVKALEHEMRVEFAKLAADDKTSGRAAEARARAALDKALGELEVARGAFHGAQQFAAFIAEAAEGETYWRGATTPALDLSAHAPRLQIRQYSSDPTPQIELSDVVSIIRNEMGE
jgi:hypothetical protein